MWMGLERNKIKKKENKNKTANLHTFLNKHE